MAFDRLLGDRMRRALRRRRGITDKQMFGGLAFLVDGKMFCGVIGDAMVVRVGPERYEKALARPHTTKMDFTGKPMRGYIYVKKEGLQRVADIAFRRREYETSMRRVGLAALRNWERSSMNSRSVVQAVRICFA